MKKLIAGVLIFCFLMTAIPAFAELFIRIDRDDPEAWKKRPLASLSLPGRIRPNRGIYDDL